MRRDLALVPAVRDVISRFPGGLGRPAAGVAASSALPELLAAVEPDERRVLETLAAGPPVGRSRGGADPTNPVSRLLARGLLVRVDAETVELPRQVGLALRGDRPLGTLSLDPPDLVTVDRGVDTVDGTAAVAALRALRQVEQLVASGAPRRRRPCARAARRARAAPGGLRGRRRRDGCAARRARGRRPVAESDGVPQWGPPLRPTSGRASRAEVGQVARAWLELRGCRASSAPATTPGGRSRHSPTDHAGRRLRATAVACSPARGAAGTAVGAAKTLRHRQAGQGPEPGVSGPSEALADLLAWRAPRRGGRLRDEVVRWTLAEATVLGLVALDALSTPGRTLLADSARAAAALRAALPDPIGHILLQADLTAVAPGRSSLAWRDWASARTEVGRRGDRLAGSAEATIRAPGRRARGRAARSVRHPVGHAGAPGADLPGRRRRPQARAAARRRGGVVPAQRRRGADRRGARLSGRRAAGAAPDRADRGGVAAATGRADGRAARRRVHPCGRGSGRGGARPDRPRPADPATPARRGTAGRGAGSRAAAPARVADARRRRPGRPAPRHGRSRPGTRRPGGATVEIRAAARERRSVWIGFVDGHGVGGKQGWSHERRRRVVEDATAWTAAAPASRCTGITSRLRSSRTDAYIALAVIRCRIACSTSAMRVCLTIRGPGRRS